MLHKLSSLASLQVRLTILGILFYCIAPAQQLQVKINYVSDGDTYYAVSSSGEEIRIRLAEVDCPEKNQAFGQEAKLWAKNLIEKKQVSISIQNTDKYGRKIASVKYQQIDLAEALVSEGLAWHYKLYSKSDILSQLEKEAQAGKKGLWSSADPIAPWDWRHKR